MLNEENKNEITLFIPESITNNSNFSNYAIAVYCTLQTLSVPIQLPKQCITIHQITYYLMGEILQQRNRINNYIKCGLNELIENNIIIKNNEFQKHYILDCSNLWIDTKKEKFTKITFDEVQKIFKVENINNFLLLRYFISIMGTISSKITVYLSNGNYKNRVIGNLTIDYLSELTGISDRTIIEYNKILENIGLLYIFRQNDFIIDKENNIKRLPNIYGRPCDKEYIETFANNQQKHFKSYYYVKNNIQKANNKRKLAQMYQQLLKGGGDKYSNEEITNIYHYIISENKKYERMYNKNGYEEYLNKIRDVNIFKKYNFIHIKEE